jgi:hypothetical protein
MEESSMTPKCKRRWAARAYQHWLEHGGRYSLNDAVAATAPRDIPVDDYMQHHTAVLTYVIATAQTIHSAIMEGMDNE